MKQTFFTLLLSGLVLFASCGSKAESDTATEATDKDGSTVEIHNSAGPRLETKSYKIGGQTYTVTLQRQPAQNAPTVTDDFGTVFYDNDVRISIKPESADSLIFDRHFTKADFQDFIPKNLYSVSVLHGMAFSTDAKEKNRIVFGAQVGEPGLEGEGPTFAVSISLNGEVGISPVEDDISLSTSDGQEGN